jgi:methyl-accepting chemotaxis protein
MRDAQRRIANGTRNIILLTAAVEMAAEEKNIAKAREDYASAEAVLQKKLTTETGKAILKKIDAARAITTPFQNKAIQLGLEDKTEEATAVIINEVAPRVKIQQAAIDEMLELQKHQNEASEETAKHDYTSAQILMISMSALAISLGILISWMVTRSITRPLAAAVEIAQTVASGDLTSYIEVTSSDETGQLMQALKDMNDSLVNIVDQVRTGTDTIASASSQIASGNLDLSSRTEQQASSLEETASSMEELTSTVKQNADNARQANSLAKSASDVASQGGAVVAQVVDTMSAINDSAKKIVDIISVIDGIAFQTNILALNAAVEAARAGEQGRGFAVVATEVRNLAQRSAGAAKEIKALIGDSVEKVQEGSKLVEKAGSTMNEVVESVKRVTDVIGEIAAASQEQSAGIDQINIAITEMDDVTQQNAALVEEAAAAAASLEDQAGKLAQVVSVFRSNGMRGQNALPTPAARQTARITIAAVKPRLSAVHNIKRVDPAKQLKQGAGGSVNDDWEEF